MFTVEEENRKAIENGGTPALQKRVLLGITKAALLPTRSFPQLPSRKRQGSYRRGYQEQVDPLVGLKENVIIGKLIPRVRALRNIRICPRD